MPLILCSFAMLLCISTPAYATGSAPQKSVSCSENPACKYTIDAVLIALGATLTGVFTFAVEPSDEALIGPQFRTSELHIQVDQNGSSEGTILSSAFHDDIGHDHVANEDALVPNLHLALWALPAAAMIFQDFYFYDGAQKGLDSMLGLMESVALTVGVTSVLKATVGRLRPDFQDRIRELCTTTSEGFDCRASALDDTSEAVLRDGRRSFPSGHSSLSFVVATYVSLSIGERWVWGDDASELSMGLGIASQVLLVAGATYVAASRIVDHQHDPGDVVVGSLLGIGFANFSYWRRFGGDDGDAYTTTIVPRISPDHFGAVLGVSF